MIQFVISGVMLICALASPLTVWAGGDADQGIAYYKTGDYESAREIFERILAGQDTDETALFYLGKIHLDLSDLDGAREHLEKLVVVRPGRCEYELALGEVYGEKARTSGFILAKKKWAGKWKEQLEIAFELDPQDLDAREWLAIYVLNAPGFGGGDKDRGTKIARETIEIDKVFGRLLLGYAYRRSDKVDLAIEEYLAVLNMDPQNGRAYSGLGYCFLQREDFENAEVNFKKAVEYTPDDELAYQGMAYYWSKREAKEEEAESQEHALRINPLLSDVRYDLARNYQARRATSLAIHHYETLIDLTPRHYKAGSARKRLKKLREKRGSR